ncbi:hypothetical protein HYV84_01315 [Candidatus Woesearchaeota archaeon]|nr:hypothetical protein [Candidatus Woesearchaeota archaeon]
MVWKFLETYPPGELLEGGLLRHEYKYLGDILDVIKKNHPLQEAIISEKIIPYERELVHAAKRVFELSSLLREYLRHLPKRVFFDEWDTLTDIIMEIEWAKDNVNRETTAFFRTLYEIVSEQNRFKAELEENQRRLAELGGVASRNIKHLQQEIKERWDELERLLITRLRIDTFFWDGYLGKLQALEEEIHAKERASKERGVAA